MVIGMDFKKLAIILNLLLKYSGLTNTIIFNDLIKQQVIKDNVQ